MSADQRIKKLRGSGGYVMATVDDGQQSKGNLGGPDLFLAPIGRLEESSISRYYCNTCEKEFEGSPKIDYESPNEEVAENLILAERGKYVCAPCGSAIAEYRQFSKPDEAVEVGLAKPISGQAEPAAAPDAGDSWDQPGDVRSIDGMEVYDSDGIRAGTAKQVGVNESRSMVLVISRQDGTEESVPWSRVKTVGQIILLGKEGAGPAEGSPECPGCGFENKAESKFCEQCGAKVYQ